MLLNLCGNQKLERYYTCGDHQALWRQNACALEFKGIFETQNVVLVSGLQLGYGYG